MEQWEKELRKKLEKELPEGGYDIGNSGMACWTGKQGYIEYRVALIKAINNFDWSAHKSNEDEKNPTFEILDPPPHPADISKSVHEWHKEVLSVDEIIERYALTEEQIKNLQKLNK
jgi:hypothetical protein